MKRDTRQFYLHAAERVVRHLIRQLDRPPNLDELARVAGLSPFHFHRVFRGIVGETALELHRRLRLERAALALRESSHPVTRIALEAGFETHESFTRAFRLAFGAPPSAFRRARHGRPLLAAPSGVHYAPDGAIPTIQPLNTGAEQMKIHIETLPAMRLALVPHRGPYNQIGQAFERLGQIAGAAGLMGGPESHIVALYHDDPEGKPASELRSDAGVTIPDGVRIPDGLAELRLPGGRFARYTHVGPFTALGDVWPRFMGEAIPAQGLTIGEGAALEIYRSDMRSTPPSEFRTDLLVRLTDPVTAPATE